MPMIPANHTYLDTFLDEEHTLRAYWKKKDLLKLEKQN